MELRDFVMLFVRSRKIVLWIMILWIVVGGIFFMAQRQTYKTSLQLNITREHAKPLDVYTYDQFYRLQADERFADTVVQWILSPSVQEKLFIKNGHITAKRLSSQVIEVTYVTDTVHDADLVSQKLVRVLNDVTQKLNAQQQQENWFTIIAEAPVINDHTYRLPVVLMIAFCGGLFTAFWGVLLCHYMRNER